MPELATLKIGDTVWRPLREGGGETFTVSRVGRKYGYIQDPRVPSFEIQFSLDDGCLQGHPYGRFYLSEEHWKHAQQREALEKTWQAKWNAFRACVITRYGYPTSDQFNCIREAFSGAEAALRELKEWSDA